MRPQLTVSVVGYEKVGVHAFVVRACHESWIEDFGTDETRRKKKERKRKKGSLTFLFFSLLSFLSFFLSFVLSFFLTLCFV